MICYKEAMEFVKEIESHFTFHIGCSVSPPGSDWMYYKLTITMSQLAIIGDNKEK